MVGKSSALALAIAVIATLSTAATAIGARSSTPPRGSIARVLKVDDTAHLRYAEEYGSEVIDEGTATGTVPGTVRVTFSLNASVAAAFTIYTHTGSILGHGYGTLHNSNGKSARYVSFAGKMTVTRGTGRYAHAHGEGNIYGVIDRATDAVTIQTIGSLSY